MALYVKKFTVPASTLESSPYETTLTIKEKYIYEMEVSFPDGANWLVGVQIHYGIRRLWPENEDEWIYGNDETIVWREHQYLPEKESVLTIKAISPNAEFDHDIIVRIKTLPDWVAVPGIYLSELVGLIKRMLFG